MEIKIGPYKNWFGPYQLAELICFWAKDEVDEYGFKHKPKWVHNFGWFLAHGSIPKNDDESFSFSCNDHKNTWLYNFLLWIDSKRKRKIKVKIDSYDVWSMDNTLAYIVLPMLKQLKEVKHGYPLVDIEDLPKHLKYADLRESDYSQMNLFSSEVCNPEQIDIKYDQWNWVLDEMIFAFECKTDDSWEDQFHTGKTDFISEVCERDENGKPKLYRLVEGPNHTSKYDHEGHMKMQERISNGFRLFGKYYEALWD